MDIEQVRHSLGCVCLVEDCTLPSWAQTLTEIIQTAKSYTFQDEGLTSKPPTDPENALPFEDVLLPAFWVARQKLLTSLGSASLSPNYLPLELLSEEAYVTLERSLLQELVNLCEKTLEFEFSHSRPLGHSLFNLLGKEPKGSNAKIIFHSFGDVFPSIP